MKKAIFLNLIILSIYFGTSFTISNWKENYLLNNYPGEFQNFTLTDDIDVVNVGTSHGSVSFDWKIVNDVKGINLGRSGQPFLTDEYLLEKYSDFLENSLLIVPISFHSFCLANEIYTPVAALFESALPFFGIVQTTASINLLSDSRGDRPFPADMFSNHNDVKPNLTPRLDCDKDTIDGNLEILSNLTNKYSVVLVTTPYYSPSLANINEFNEFYDLINSITTTYDLTYYDYSRDSRFNHSSYFYNSTHLNTKGREIFTKLFIEEVLEIYLNSK